MIDPYRMVLVNVVATGFILFAGLFYKFAYPKKNPPHLLTLFVLSLLPLISILRKGSYESGDLSLHVSRAMSFYNLFINQLTIPRWSPELNLGYGDAYFQFIYFLPYAFISLFHLIGFSFLASAKLLVAVSYILSGLFFYGFARKSFDKTPALVGAIFYLFTPYRLVDMHFRVSIAEDLSFVFIPLLFLMVHKFALRFREVYVLPLGLITAGLLLTHQVIFVVSLPFAVLYFLLMWHESKSGKKTLAYFFSGIGLGLSLSAFYWLPILMEKSYIFQNLVKNQISFVSFPMLLFSPWRFGFLFQGHFGELSFILGYTQLIVLLICLFFLINKKLKAMTSKAFFFTGSYLFLLFMITPYSRSLWKVIPLLGNFQFSYRLLALECFLIAVIASIVVNKLRNKYFITLLCAISITYTILNWGNRRAIAAINDSYLYNNLLNGPTITGMAEPTTPIWAVNGKDYFIKRPKSKIELLSGKAQIKIASLNPLKQEYLIETKEKSSFKLNTFYFPGWTLVVNGSAYPSKHEDSKYPGVILFDLTKGLYDVKLSFENTAPRRLGELISALAVAGAAGYFLVIRKR